jgi:hypothetical protein
MYYPTAYINEFRLRTLNLNYCNLAVACGVVYYLLVNAGRSINDALPADVTVRKI